MRFLNSKPIFTSSLIGTLSLGAMLLGSTTPATAACGPGNDWVSSCAAGVDTFPTSFSYIDSWITFPNQPMQRVRLDLTGPSLMTRFSPVDSLPPYPNSDPNWNAVGTVGLTNGYDGVIPINVDGSFKVGDFTLVGKGYGAIAEATESGIARPDLASSFFQVFGEVQTPMGNARNQTPITMYSNKWLTGVSPQEVAPIFPGQVNPASLTDPTVSSAPAPNLPNLPASFDTAFCNSYDPTGAISYCGFGDVPFYEVNANGDFVDRNGNVTTDPSQFLQAAVVHTTVYVVPVPEPLTILGSLAAVGFGTVMEKKRNQKKAKK